MKSTEYGAFKARMLEQAKEEARKAIAFASIGTKPLAYLTPEQRAEIEAALIHFASLGASATVAHCRLHAVNIAAT